MSLAEHLKEQRMAVGLSRADLARPRYTASYVSQIESGRRRPSAEALAYFADRLGISPTFLATGVPDGEERRLTDRLEEARDALSDGRMEDADRIVAAVREAGAAYGLSPIQTGALVTAAEIRLRQDRTVEAISLYERALESDLSRAERGSVIAAIARAHRRLGEITEAAERVESFLRQRGGGPLDPAVAADLQTVLVGLYFERGDVVRAERTAARAVAAAEQGTPPETRAQAYWGASRILAEAGRSDEAIALIERARALLGDDGDRRRLARVFNAMAHLYLEADPPRTQDAAVHLERAEEILSTVGSRTDLGYVLTERARIALLEGRPGESADLAERAVAAAGADDLEAGRALYVRGRALAQVGRGNEAREALTDAAGRFASSGARQQQASCWRELGELEIADDELGKALAAFRAAFDVLTADRARP